MNEIFFLTVGVTTLYGQTGASYTSLFVTYIVCTVVFFYYILVGLPCAVTEQFRECITEPANGRLLKKEQHFDGHFDCFVKRKGGTRFKDIYLTPLPIEQIDDEVNIKKKERKKRAIGERSNS